MPKNGCSISSFSIGIHLHCFQSRHILLSKIFKAWNVRQQFPYSENMRKFVHYAEYLLPIESFETYKWNTKSLLPTLFRSNSTNTPKKQKRGQNLDQLIAENAIKLKG